MGRSRMNSKELQAALLKMEIDNENKVGEVTKAIKKESNKKTKVNIESILSEIELSKIIVDMLDHETCDLIEFINDGEYLKVFLEDSWNLQIDFNNHERHVNSIIDIDEKLDKAKNELFSKMGTMNKLEEEVLTLIYSLEVIYDLRNNGDVIIETDFDRYRDVLINGC